MQELGLLRRLVERSRVEIVDRLPSYVTSCSKLCSVRVAADGAADHGADHAAEQPSGLGSAWTKLRSTAQTARMAGREAAAPLSAVALVMSGRMVAFLAALALESCDNLRCQRGGC